MRPVCLGVVVLCLIARIAAGAAGAATEEKAGGVAAGQGAGDGSAPGRDAAEVLAATREALGGREALDSILRVRATGRATRNVGPLSVPSVIEWLLESPDRFVRIDRLLLAGTTSELVSGFHGRSPVQRATGPGGLQAGATPAPGAQALAAAPDVAALGARQDLARILLGFFADTRVYPVEFSSAGRAEAPEGAAHVLDVRGADGFECRLFVDAATRLPLMVTWMAPDVLGHVRRLSERLAAGGGAPTPQELEAWGQTTAEHRLYFADYRRVDDVRWPFRIRRASGGEIVEELTFERFELNPAIDVRLFEPEP